MSDKDTALSPVLKRCTFFQNLEPAERDVLIQSAEEVQLAAGERLFGLGEPMPRFYLILSGEVALTFSMKLRDEEKEITLETKGEGSLIGWSALVRPHRSTLGAKATEPTRLLAFERETLNKTFEDHPRIQVVTQVNISEIIAGRLRTFEALLVHDLKHWASKVA